MRDLQFAIRNSQFATDDPDALRAAFAPLDEWEARLRRIVTTLRLAVENDQAAFVFAVYRSEATVEAAERALARLLRAAGLTPIALNAADAPAKNIVQFLLDAQSTLRAEPQGEANSQFTNSQSPTPIFSLHNLRACFPEGLGYLNWQRERLAAARLRVIFWAYDAPPLPDGMRPPTPGDLRYLAREAPDFWAFRHRTVELLERPAEPAFARAVWALPREWARDQDKAEIQAGIALRERLLGELDADDPATAPSRASLLHDLGNLHYGLGERRRALKYYEQALSFSREVGDRAGEATALTNIGTVYARLGERQLALEYYEQALPIRREVGDRAREAATLNNIGAVYHGLGEGWRALEYYEQALPIDREVGDRAGEATTLTNIGLVYYNLGERRRALEYYAQALPIRREVGDRAGETRTLNNIGAVYNALGERRRALDYYERALPILREVGDRLGEATMLWNMGDVYEKLGEYAQAEPLLARAVELLRAVESPKAERAQEWLDRVRARLEKQGGEIE